MPSQARYTHLEAEALPAEFYLSAGVINLGFGVLKHAAVPVLPLQETGITVWSIHNTSLYKGIVQYMDVRKLKYSKIIIMSNQLQQILGTAICDISIIA